LVFNTMMALRPHGRGVQGGLSLVVVYINNSTMYQIVSYLSSFDYLSVWRANCQLNRYPPQSRMAEVIAMDTFGCGVGPEHTMP
jgi:hypothetical protein